MTGMFPGNKALTLSYEMLDFGTENGYFMVFSERGVFAWYVILPNNIM